MRYLFISILSVLAILFQIFALNMNRAMGDSS